MLHVAGLLW